jgi:hypothetical protein
MGDRKFLHTMSVISGNQHERTFPADNWAGIHGIRVFKEN